MMLCGECNGKGMYDNNLCEVCGGEGVLGMATFTVDRVSHRRKVAEFSEQKSSSKKNKIDKKNAVRSV